jgi:hypothetical protein
MGTSASDVIGRGLVDVLKAELEVFQAGFDEGSEAVFAEPDAGGDHVDVKPGCAGGADELSQIFAGEGFSSGEMDVEDAKLGGLLKDALPIFGGEFFFGAVHLEWIRAIEAVERAAVSDLGDQRGGLILGRSLCRR